MVTLTYEMGPEEIVSPPPKGNTTEVNYSTESEAISKIKNFDSGYKNNWMFRPTGFLAGVECESPFHKDQVVGFKGYSSKYGVVIKATSANKHSLNYIVKTYDFSGKKVTTDVKKVNSDSLVQLLSPKIMRL